MWLESICAEKFGIAIFEHFGQAFMTVNVNAAPKWRKDDGPRIIEMMGVYGIDGRITVALALSNSRHLAEQQHYLHAQRSSTRYL